MIKMPVLEGFTTPFAGYAMRCLEALIWYGLLLLIGSMSFIFGGYATQTWLLFSGCFYLWFCIAAIVIVSGGRCSIRALRSARILIGLFALSLLWVWLPLIVPYKHALYELMVQNNLSGVDAPKWFSPDRVWSAAPQRTRWLLFSELLIFCVFVSTLVLLDSRRRLKQLLVVFMLVGVLHAAIGLFGKYANLLFVNAKEVDGHFTVARGLFINRNHFAAFLVLTLVGSLAYQWRILLSGQNDNAKQLAVRHFAVKHLGVLLVFMVTLAGIVSSQSRGPTLSLGAALGLALVLAGTMNLRNRRIILIPFAILSIVAMLYFGQDLIVRLGQSALSLGERWNQWAITFEAIRANPILGYGGGSYSTVFQIFRDQAELRDVIFAQSHNHYLHLWLERGLIGLIIWLCIVGLIIHQVKRVFIKVNSDLIGGVLFASLTVVLAALIQSLVDFNLQIINIRAYFFVIVALVYASPHVNRKRI